MTLRSAIPATVVGALVAAAVSSCSRSPEPKDVTQAVEILCAEVATLKAKGVKLPAEVDEYLGVVCHVANAPDGG